MGTIDLSLAGHWIADDQQSFQQIMDKLSAQMTFSLNTEFIEWRDMWTRLSTIATEKKGPLVSEVGSTWIASFDAKNALHTFTDDDINVIGGEKLFLAWEVGSPVYKTSHVAIPWMADSQVIYYWKDMLETANVNVEEAFQTISNFEDTLARVAHLSFKYPWAISTTRFPANMHQLACWVWGVGGDFLDDTGNSIRFLEDEAIQAMVKFFSLHRYIPQYRSTSPIDMAQYFANREASITMGGIKIYHQIKRHLSPEQMQNVGVSLPPGVPFVGCESLVMWSHTPPELRADVLYVINQLMSPVIQVELAEILDLIPTRVSVLNQPPYNSDPFLRMLGRAVAIGRSYPAVAAWGEIENQLMDIIVNIWEEIFADGNPDVENIVRKHLIRLGQSVRSIL